MKVFSKKILVELIPCLYYAFKKILPESGLQTHPQKILFLPVFLSASAQILPGITGIFEIISHIQ